MYTTTCVNVTTPKLNIQCGPPPIYVHTAPTGVTIERVGVTWILLSWQPNSAVETYVVAVSGGDTENHYSVEGTKHNITDLKVNTEYTLTVTAVANDGETSLPSISVTTVTAIPGRNLVHLYKES